MNSSSLPVNPGDLDLSAFAELVMGAVKAGNGVLLVALVLLFTVAGVRHFFSDKLPFLKTDLGAAGFTLLMGLLGGVVSALEAGAKLSPDLLLSVLKVAFAAMGGFAAIKKVLLPLLDLLLAKLGVKLPPGVLDGAAKAGEAALKEKPGAGIAGVVGPIEEVK